MSGRDEQIEDGRGDAPEPATAVAEPIVIDLRDGVDTVAAYEADQARRATPPRPS
ncbi:MAG TPA: hypothetical protein VFU19_10810 [Iamia sp.]|nr:hypothetical protein [Iamia sp.]